MMQALVVDDVKKTLGGRPVVAGLSMTVSNATIHGFLGPNGSGKTTTLRMIMSILLPDSGKVEILGDRTRGAARARIGYLPEERGLYRKMAVRSLLRYLGSLRGMERGEAGISIDRWLDRLGLSDAAKKPVEALSKGMAQKVQFIAAVMGDPDVLVLDEPFAGLDPLNVDAMKDVLVDLKRRGVAILLSTHDMAAAEDLCDRVSMIFAGKKLADGTLDEIRRSAGPDRVRVRIRGERRLLEAIPEVDAVVDEGDHHLVRLRGESRGFLKSLADRTEVLEYRIERRSLHEVFVDLAKGI
jgi:ABC-2 type transport system ATP-binding protein